MGRFRVSQKDLRSSGTLRFSVRPCVDAHRKRGTSISIGPL